MANSVGNIKGMYHGESTQPRRVNMRNCGTLRTTCGKNSVLISIENRNAWPLKRKRPKPYAVRVTEITVKRTLGKTILYVLNMLFQRSMSPP